MMNLISQLNTLESSGLIRLLRAQPELEYLFRHALSQDAAYNSLLRQDRKHLHLAVAESLENLYPEQTGELAATLAWHFEHTEFRDKAAHYLRQAGDSARAMYANQEALGFYERAITHIEQLRKPGAGQAEQWREAEIEVREAIADLSELSGNHDEALAGYDLVLDMLTSEQYLIQARLHRKSANIRVTQRDFESAGQYFDAAETALGDSTEERPFEEWNEWILIRLDRSWMLYLTVRIDEMMALAEKVRPVVERHGTPMHRSRYFMGLASACNQKERFNISDRSLALAVEAYKAWQEAGSIIESGLIVFGLGFAHLWRGEYEESERMLLYGLSLTEKSGDLITQSFYLTYLTVLYRKLGKKDKVKEFAARSLDVSGKIQSKLYQSAAMANFAWIAWREQRPADAKRFAQESMDFLAKMVYPFRWLALWPLLGVALQEGQLSNAADCARKMLAPHQQLLPTTLTAALEQAIEDVEQGQTDQARTQFEEAIGLAGQMGYL